MPGARLDVRFVNLERARGERRMKRKALLGLFTLFLVLPLGIGATTNAWADSFTFNVDFCSNPCLGGVPANNNGGTVTLTQLTSGGSNSGVQVAVQLASGVNFHDQGL